MELCRPAPLPCIKIRKGEDKGRKREKFYIYLDVTHTQKLLHRDTFNTCTDKLLDTANFYTQHLLHTASFHTQQAFRHRTLTHSTCTHCFYTWQAFTHTNFYTQELQLQNRISTPKQKKDDFEAQEITSAIAKIC